MVGSTRWKRNLEDSELCGNEWEEGFWNPELPWGCLSLDYQPGPPGKPSRALLVAMDKALTLHQTDPDVNLSLSLSLEVLGYKMGEALTFQSCWRSWIEHLHTLGGSEDTGSCDVITTCLLISFLCTRTLQRGGSCPSFSWLFWVEVTRKWSSQDLSPVKASTSVPCSI